MENGKYVCKRCSSSIDKGYSFCPFCGARDSLFYTTESDYRIIGMIKIREEHNSYSDDYFCNYTIMLLQLNKSTNNISFKIINDECFYDPWIKDESFKSNECITNNISLHDVEINCNVYVDIDFDKDYIDIVIKYNPTLIKMRPTHSEINYILNGTVVKLEDTVGWSKNNILSMFTIDKFMNSCGFNTFLSHDFLRCVNATLEDYSKRVLDNISTINSVREEFYRDNTEYALLRELEDMKNG